MKKTIPAAIAAVAVLALAACLLIFFAPNPVPVGQPECVEGFGEPVSREIPVGSFSAIEASGQIELYLKQADSESVAIETQESLAGLVFAEGQGGVLRIGLANFGQAGTPKPCIGRQTKIKVFVSASGIESVKASNLARVFTEGRIYSEQLSLEASGSALIDANVSVDDLNSFASGFGTIILSGLAERHNAKAVTGGRIIAGKLEALQGFFEASGNGSIGSTVFGEVSAVARTGGAVSFWGGATVTSIVEESGGVVTELPYSGGYESHAPVGGGSLPDEGMPPVGDDGNPAEDSGSEMPSGPACGNMLVEAPEECEADSGCAVGEECSACECTIVPAPEFMQPGACIALGGSVACAESPACALDAKNAGFVEGNGLPCLCCITA